MASRSRTCFSYPPDYFLTITTLLMILVSLAYPKACDGASRVLLHNKPSPTQRAHTALSVSLAAARSTSTIMKRISATGKMSHREAAAVRDCVEVVGDSVDELERSLAMMGHLGGRNLGSQIDSMQTWVSAALADDDTCMDGFEGNGMKGNIKNEVRSHVMKVAKLTSEALALVNALVSSYPTTTTRPPP